MRLRDASSSTRTTSKFVSISDGRINCANANSPWLFIAQRYKFSVESKKLPPGFIGWAKDGSMDYLWWLICLEICFALSLGPILIYNLIFSKNRQPSGRGYGSGWYTGASAFICALKPSGDCLDGWRIRGRNRMEGDGQPYYCLVRLLHAIWSMAYIP